MISSEMVKIKIEKQASSESQKWKNPVGGSGGGGGSWRPAAPLPVSLGLLFVNKPPPRPVPPLASGSRRWGGGGGGSGPRAPRGSRGSRLLFGGQGLALPRHLLGAWEGFTAPALKPPPAVTLSIHGVGGIHRGRGVALSSPVPTPLETKQKPHPTRPERVTGGLFLCWLAGIEPISDSGTWQAAPPCLPCPPCPLCLRPVCPRPQPSSPSPLSQRAALPCLSLVGPGQRVSGPCVTAGLG